MCTFGVLGLSCASPGGPVAGVSHDSPRAQTCTFEGSGLQKHHQNSTKRTNKRGKKRIKTVAGEGKKRAKFWAVRRRGVRRREVPRRGVRRRGPEHTHHTQHTPTPTPTTIHTKTNHNNTKKKWIGQKWIGQNWIGQNWQTTNH